MSATPVSSQTTTESASYKDRLLEIANRVNAATGIRDILNILKDRVPDLVGAERVTVYALDVKNQQLYTLMVVGEGVKEIRIPKTFSSIAGFTALSKKSVNIQDAYDHAELSKIHANLRLDQRWDQKEGFKTKQVLASPILFEKYLMGVIQVINKVNGEFTLQQSDLISLGEALVNPARIVTACHTVTLVTVIDQCQIQRSIHDNPALMLNTETGFWNGVAFNYQATLWNKVTGQIVGCFKE